MNSKFNGAGKDSPASCLSKSNVSAASILPDEILPLRLKSVAQITDVSEKTVRRWIERGLLRSHKLGGARVVRKRDLRAFLDEQAGATNNATS